MKVPILITLLLLLLSSAAFPDESLPGCTIAILTTLPLDHDKDEAARHIRDYLQSKSGIKVIPCEQNIVTAQPVDCNVSPEPSATELTGWARSNSADFMLLVDAYHTNRLTAVSIALVETRSGLRLTDATWIWAQDWIPRILEDTYTHLTVARLKSEEPDVINITVPPFECRDMGFSHRYLQEPLATILQHALLGYPDVRTVEWKSVQKLVGYGDQSEPAAYQLPVMVRGYYESLTHEGDPGVMITLELHRAGQLLSAKELPFIKITDLPQRLPAYTYELLGMIHDRLADPHHTIRETSDLEQYAASSFALGNYKSAWSLSESAVLIRPASKSMRTIAIQSLCMFAESRFKPVSFGHGVPVDPDERRLWASEMAMRHVDYLLHNAFIDDETFESIAMYRRNISRTPISHGDFGRELRDGIKDLRFILVDSYLDYIDRLVSAGHTSDTEIMRWAFEIMYAADVVAGADQDIAYALVNRLCDVIPPSGISFRQILQIGLMLDVLMHFGGPPYDLFIDRLAYSGRQDFQIAAAMLRACQNIHDGDSFITVKHEIRKRLPEWGVPNDMMVQINRVMLRHAQFKKIETDPDPLAEQRVVGPPSLTRLPEWPPNMLRACGDSTPDTSQRDRNGNLEGMIWDGQYWWDICGDSITVHGNDRIWTATADSLGLGTFHETRACAIDKGRIAIAGALFSNDSVHRTWIAVMSITDGGRAPLVDVIYEGKQQFAADQYGHDPMTSFKPAWIHYLPQGKLNARNDCLLVGRDVFAQPLILPLDHSAPEVLNTRWPLSGVWPRVWTSTIWDESRSQLYIATGHAYNEQWAGVYRCDDLDTTPALVVDFGHRPFHEPWVFDPYFQSVVMHQGILHLLTSTAHRKPNWLTVDPKSGESFQIATEFPHPLTHMKLMSIAGDLYLSVHNDLFKVTVPDRDQWVQYPRGPQDLVRLAYRNNEVSEVYIAGEFNRWNTRLWPMHRNEDGLWTTSLRLPRGIYGYKLVADGEWLLDPANDDTINVDGHDNSMLDTSE